MKDRGYCALALACVGFGLAVLISPKLCASPVAATFEPCAAPKQQLDTLLSDFQKGTLTRQNFLTAALSLSTCNDPPPTDLQPVTLDHLTIRVPNIERTSAFYQELLDMPLKRVIPGDTHYLGVGSSFLGIQSSGQQPAFIHHFCLGLKNFDSAKLIEKLHTKGIEVEGPVYANTIRFTDPDGLEMQLCSVDYAIGQTSKVHHISDGQTVGP